MRCSRVAAQIPLRGLDVERLGRQPQHQPMRAPVGKIQECIKVLLHPCGGITLEVTPFIVIDEARGRDGRAGRVFTQLTDVVLCEGSIEGQEFVVLILTHGAAPRRNRFPSRRAAFFCSRRRACSSIEGTTPGRSRPKRFWWRDSMKAGSGSFQGSWSALSSFPSFLGFMPSSRAI